MVEVNNVVLGSKGVFLLYSHISIVLRREVQLAFVFSLDHIVQD
jgi:hypothetical protein